MKKLTFNLLLILACGSSFAAPVQDVNTNNIKQDISSITKKGDPVPIPTKGCMNFPVPCEDK